MADDDAQKLASDASVAQERLHAVGWAATTLGEPSTWPQALRAALASMARIERAACVVWGAEWWPFPNDAFRRAAPCSSALLDGPARAAWPAEWPRAASAIEAAITRAASSLIAESVQLEGGGTLWLEVAPIRYEIGVVGGALLTLDERAPSEVGLAEVEARLAASEQALDDTQRMGGTGSWELDLETGEVRWSRQAYALYGVDPKTFTPSLAAFRAFIHPDDRARVEGIIQDVLARGGAVDLDFRIVTPAGATRWLWSRGEVTRFAPDGKPRTMTGVNQDITEQRLAEHLLRESERLYSGLFDGSPVASALVRTSDGTCAAINQAFARLFEVDARDAIGKTALALGLVDAEVSAELRAAVARDGLVRDLERTVWTRTGRRLTAIVDVVPVSVGAAHYRLTTVRDVTAQRSTEEELRARSRQLGRLSAQLTLAESSVRDQIARTLHDGLQQMLFATRLKLDRAAKLGSDDERAGRLVESARGDLEDAIAAVRSLAVDLAPRSLRDGGLGPAIEWLAEWTRSKYGMDVELELDLGVDTTTHEVRILVFESIRELLFNAVKHAKVERVTLTVACAADDVLRVTVADDGVGFDPATLGGEADREQGGLGLLGIRERLALIGGTFDVASAPGAGSTFRLLVPRSATAIPEESQ